MELHRQGFQDSTEKLVERCLLNDAHAWQELVQRYAKLVHSVPVRYGLSAMEVDDIGQDVFLTLARHLHRIEDPKRLPAWLLTTARRATWRVLQKRRQEHPGEAGDLLAADGESEIGPLTRSTTNHIVIGAQSPTIQELVDGWGHQEVLYQGFEKLGERCRELLALLFLDETGPSYEEISARLSIPLGSIGPTRSRCLQRLRSILEGLGYGDIL